jgi:hypothetical protein
MKRLILVLLVCAAGVCVRAQEKDSLLVMFWNLENFFDWRDQGIGESDSEFSSRGSRSWTKSRFYSKCNAISKSVFWLSDKYGKMPDAFGVCEIENKVVLKRLLSSTLLRKYDYDIIHFESMDRRGIDVALMYRKSSLSPLSTSLKTPLYNGEKLRTRDMLHVQMKSIVSGDTLDFIVCHHPSKYGGADVSQGRRYSAMESLYELCDSIGSNKQIVMGDFNDVPSADQFEKVSDILINKAENLYEQGEGTIRYKGKWDMIDMFMVSPLFDGYSTMEIEYIPFLMVYDKSYPGEKPLRTYSGPKYLGGVSDHCPIILKILLPLKDFR